MHSVYCELWDVHDGAIRIGDLDQHAFWELGGRASGALAGATLGAWFAMLSGVGQAWSPRQRAHTPALRSPATMIAEGLAVGAHVVPQLARSASRATAQALGTYREAMLWIPDVLLEGQPQPHAFVLEMRTDSRIARWADIAFGYGYNKRRAAFQVAAPADWTLLDEQRCALLSFHGTSEATLTRQQLELQALEAAVRMPLLGVTRGGEFSRSWLERSFAAAPELFAITGTLQVSAGLIPGSEIRYVFGPPRARGAWQVLQFSNLGTAVSYPSVLS
jgi:hypothetical protein